MPQICMNCAQFKNSVRWLFAYLSIKSVITGGMQCYWWQNQLKRQNWKKKKSTKYKDAEYFMKQPSLNLTRSVFPIMRMISICLQQKRLLFWCLLTTDAGENKSKAFALRTSRFRCVTYLRDINVGASYQARDSLNFVRAPSAGHSHARHTLILLQALTLLALLEK